MDVARWLRGLGLQRYEQAFRENDFDAEILPELTGEDLVGLGVNSVGHRRKLLAAIAVLRAEVSPTAGSAQRSEPRPMLFSTSGSDDPSVDSSPSCSATLWVLQRSRRASILRIYAT